MASLTVFALVPALMASAVCAGLQPGEKKPDAPKPASPAKSVAPAASESDKKKDEASLKVGDQAPVVKVDAWVKGAEIKAFEAGKVYVVEFWATWAPASVTSIPHLTRAQKDHPDLIVVGVAASERLKADVDGKAAEETRLEGVRAFVGKQGKNMEYRVAFAADRQMADAWMKAAQQKNLPCAFVVGHDGKLAYIGDPLKMDAALSKALKAAADEKKAGQPQAE